MVLSSRLAAVLLVVVAACGGPDGNASTLLEVPNVVDSEEAFARGVLVGAGFQVEVSTAPSSGEPGVVLAQAPVAGEMLEPETVVLLFVSAVELTTTTTRGPTTATRPPTVSSMNTVRGITYDLGILSSGTCLEILGELKRIVGLSSTEWNMSVFPATEDRALFLVMEDRWVEDFLIPVTSIAAVVRDNAEDPQLKTFAAQIDREGTHLVEATTAIDQAEESGAVATMSETEIQVLLLDYDLSFDKYLEAAFGLNLAEEKRLCLP